MSTEALAAPIQSVFQHNSSSYRRTILLLLVIYTSVFVTVVQYLEKLNKI
jgi:hypothetical protein